MKSSARFVGSQIYHVEGKHLIEMPGKPCVVCQRERAIGYSEYSKIVGVVHFSLTVGYDK